LLAACDKSICGKKLDNKGVEFYVNPRFYKDKETTKAGIRKLFSMSSSANLVGKNIVKFALELGVIDKSSIININGIPHAQMVAITI